MAESLLKKPRIYKEGAGTSTYVIGTDDIQAALSILGISPETHRWGGTDYGLYARRQGHWRACNDDRPPKDAKPGVCFRGRIHMAPAPTGPVVDQHGDVWTPAADGLMHTPETAPFPLEVVERKWGPLRPAEVGVARG